MVTKAKNTKLGLLSVLMSAGLLNLSNMPGMNSGLGSTDLSSSFATCGSFDQEIRAKGVASCEKEIDKVGVRETIRRVERETIPARPAGANGTAGVPATTVEEFEVTVELEADFCEDGRCSETQTFSSLREAMNAVKKMSTRKAQAAKKAKREEKERLAKIARCEIDEEGETIKRESKVLLCLSKKMAELSGEEAENYYAENIKDRVQGLLQSDSAQDRALGMGTLAAIGKENNLNCATRPKMAASPNPFLNQNNLNPVMSSMQPATFATAKSGEERNLIRESVCDMWAFGTYNNNLEYLRLQAAQPNANRAVIGNAIRTLKAGWGSYFGERGLALRNDPLGLNGNSTEIYNDMTENNESLSKNLQAIIDRHKDLTIDPAKENNSNGPAATGRLARGGILPSNPTGPGTPTVNPWGATAPGQQNRPTIQQPLNQGRYTGAPRVGSPVGGMGAQSVIPTAPARR